MTEAPTAATAPTRACWLVPWNPAAPAPCTPSTLGAAARDAAGRVQDADRPPASEQFHEGDLLRDADAARLVVPRGVEEPSPAERPPVRPGDRPATAKLNAAASVGPRRPRATSPRRPAAPGPGGSPAGRPREARPATSTTSRATARRGRSWPGSPAGTSASTAFSRSTALAASTLARRSPPAGSHQQLDGRASRARVGHPHLGLGRVEEDPHRGHHARPPRLALDQLARAASPGLGRVDVNRAARSSPRTRASTSAATKSGGAPRTSGPCLAFRLRARRRRRAAQPAAPPRPTSRSSSATARVIFCAAGAYGPVGNRRRYSSASARAASFP